jgi:hypothetical protein
MSTSNICKTTVQKEFKKSSRNEIIHFLHEQIISTVSNFQIIFNLNNNSNSSS